LQEVEVILQCPRCLTFDGATVWDGVIDNLRYYQSGGRVYHNCYYGRPCRVLAMGPLTAISLVGGSDVKGKLYTKGEKRKLGGVY